MFIGQSYQSELIIEIYIFKKLIST